MRNAYLLLLLLASCAAEPDTTYVAQEVDKPVEVTCKVPFISKPVDLIGALPKNATLTQGMQACFAQHDYDIGYQTQMEAALAVCE